MLAYARAVADPLDERRAGPDPARPPLPRGVQGPRAGGRVGQGQERTRCATRTRTCRGDPVPVRRGARAPGRGRGPLRGGPAPGSRSSATSWRAAGGGAPARRRVPGRGDPPDRAAGGARRRPRTARSRAPGGATSPRSSTRCTRSRRSRASSTLRAFLDYVDMVEAERAAGVVAGPAVRRGLGQGHDDPPGAKGLEFDTVFVPGLATGDAPRTTGSSTTRPSAASRSTSSCAATPPSCPRTTAEPVGRSRRR